jgi:D-amino-acid oxidase
MDTIAHLSGPVGISMKGVSVVSHWDKRVLVIGAGVSGLTSALCLARRGFDVTLVADRFAPNVTSAVAGALWEWPPAVCGRHQDQSSLARARSWCATSYATFADLSNNPATGVLLRMVTFYFHRPIAENRFQREKMEELAGQVRQFRHDPALIAENGVQATPALQDAYTYLTPMVDTDAYLRWLRGQVERADCRIVERHLTGPLRCQEEELLRHYGVATIVNCAGLGAAELAEDQMTPLRGALVRVRNDGKAMPRVTQAHCIAADESHDPRYFLFIVPRGQDLLVLGGLAEPEEWNLDIGLNNYEPIRAMYQRCQEFLPALRSAEIDIEPVRVGLRPFRMQGVCLQREPNSRLVSNYGHGGSGVTFSWGCALEVADLVAEVVADWPNGPANNRDPLPELDRTTTRTAPAPRSTPS